VSENISSLEKRLGVVEAKLVENRHEAVRESNKSRDEVLSDTFKDKTLERLTKIESKIYNLALKVSGGTVASESVKDKHTTEKKKPMSTTVFTYCQYPPNVSGNISVTNEDYMCLGASQFLNDVLIDFFLKYLKYSNTGIVDQGLMARTHIFTTFFFKRLTTKQLAPKGSTTGHPIEDNPDLTDSEKMYERVRKWTKQVNLLEKDFIVVPINEKAHWYVCIICFPSEVYKDPSNTDEEEAENPARKPCILVFDSLPDGNKEDTCEILRNYLSMEWKNKREVQGPSIQFTEVNMPQYNPQVRGQKNSKDCGIFLLQYVEAFFRSPFKIWTNSEADHMDWFSKDESMRKRANIAKLIRDMARQQHHEKRSNKRLDFPPIDFQSVDSPMKKPRSGPSSEPDDLPKTELAPANPSKPESEVNNAVSTSENDGTIKSRESTANMPVEFVDSGLHETRDLSTDERSCRGKMVVLHKTRENQVKVKKCEAGLKRSSENPEGDPIHKKIKETA